MYYKFHYKFVANYMLVYGDYANKSTSTGEWKVKLVQKNPNKGLIGVNVMNDMYNYFLT